MIFKSRASYSQNFALAISICLYFCHVIAFNLDVKFPSFYESPEKGVYFGFAVDGAASDADSWVVVGAPKSQVNGNIYKCAYPKTSTSACEMIAISKEHSRARVPHNLGSTLLTGKKKELLSCAPQFTLRSENSGSFPEIPYYDMIGICYFLTNFTAEKPITYRYTPCVQHLNAGHYGKAHSMCQAGFGAAFSKDKSKLVLGAVGSYYNQGLVMLVDNLRRNISDLPLYTPEILPEVPPGWKENDYYKQMYDVNYMGYSVAVGTIDGNLPLLVASAPRRLGFDLRGAITVYDENLVDLANFTGEQIGEYFGQGLAVVDVNGDGMDDLIVGAPLYSDFDRKEMEIGRVLVYYQQSGNEEGKRLDFSAPTVIRGNVTMARFGHTITSVDDVNQDGYNDVAISAPYERDGAADDDSPYGAVYLFNGAADGLRIQPSQVIRGVGLPPDNGPAQGFGYSIGGRVDLDRNRYPDLVVGAYLSDQVVVFRSRPVVKVTATSEISPTKIDLETVDCQLPNGVVSACFYIKTCFQYQGKRLPSSVEMGFKYDIDSTKQLAGDKRAFLLDLLPRNISLTARKQKCVDEVAYIKKEVRDKLSPIEVTVGYFLHETNRPVEPILDQLSPNLVRTRADIFKDCGDDDVCIPNLSVAAEVSPSVMLVDDYSPLQLRASVTNTADPAYLASLIVRYPPTSVAFVGLADQNARSVVTCTDQRPVLSCEVGNPLKRDVTVDVGIMFEMYDKAGNTSSYQFEAYANSSNEHNNASAMTSYQIEMKVESDIVIYNISGPEVISLEKLSEQQAAENSSSEAEDKSSNVKAVTHNYEITNRGPAMIDAATITLLWPLHWDDGSFLLALDSIVTTGPVECPLNSAVNATVAAGGGVLVPADHSEESTDYYNCHTMPHRCHEIVCNVGQMRPNQNVLIQMKGRLHVGRFLATDRDAVVTSSLRFAIEQYPYPIAPSPGPTFVSEVSTRAAYNPPQEGVAWWVYVVSIVAGLLFLLLIVLVLYKCGFFKRKRRPAPADEDTRLQQAKLMVNAEDDDDQLQEEVEARLKR